MVKQNKNTITRTVCFSNTSYEDLIVYTDKYFNGNMSAAVSFILAKFFEQLSNNANADVYNVVTTVQNNTPTNIDDNGDDKSLNKLLNGFSKAKNMDTSFLD